LSEEIYLKLKLYKDKILYCIINMSSTKDVVTLSASEQLTGRVKWFNNKAGYGFITVTDGPRSGSDIFVHQSTIQVENQQYKYLVQGEYVEFTLSAVEASADYKYQATSIKGMKGGKLLCETRNEARAAMPIRQRTVQRSDDRQPPRPRGAGPRDEQTEGRTQGQWTQTARKPPGLTRQPSRPKEE
jgi:cold shock CspA family protein